MKKNRFPIFDCSRLSILPLNQRVHDMHIHQVMDLVPPAKTCMPFTKIGRAMQQAKKNGVPIIVIIGAHVIRTGTQRFLIDLMRRGLITCLAVNGACLIHDFELALIGSTTESVQKYIREGQFGLWKETGLINDIVAEAAPREESPAIAVGRYIEENRFPHRDLSVFAEAYRLGILATCHVAIGQDIIHEHPNCNGAAWGETSYKDFLRFAAQIEQLEGGVVLSLGSAVMGPEVFLKALAMARNVAGQEGRTITRFTTLVTDLAPLPENFKKEASKNEHLYYFRPWKTLLSRSISGNGESFYAKLEHRKAVPMIWAAAVNQYKEEPVNF